MTSKEITIKKAYEFFERVTPLYYDCGKICGAKCCGGSDKDGMLLFPGEETFFENNSEFSVYYEAKYDCMAVRCKGICSRNERPLSCRIFPFFLYNNSGKISVAPDIRAIDFCPILINKEEVDKKFLRTLRVVAKLFEQDTDICSFLKKITTIMTDFNNL